MKTAYDDPSLFPLYETSEYATIATESFSGFLYWSPNFAYFLSWLITVIVIFMSSCSKQFVVTLDRMLTAASISGILCVVHARRCQMVLKFSNYVVLVNGSIFNLYSFCSRAESVWVSFMLLPANVNGGYSWCFNTNVLMILFVIF